MYLKIFFLMFNVPIFFASSWAEELESKNELNTKTVNDLKTNDLLALETQKAYKDRLKEDNNASKLQYTFFAHKPFYFLPYTYSFNPSEKPTDPPQDIDRVEAKFQFSFKLNIFNSFYNDRLRVSFGYTNLSFWQLYNDTQSRPFRETNHEPDLFLEYKPDGVTSVRKSTYYRLGVMHQSNGQDVELSRSWDRVYAQVNTELKYTSLSLTVWERIHEKAKRTPDDPKGDDNPDIIKFMGNFELRASTKFKSNTLSVIFRNNLRSDNKGAVEVSYSFPIGTKFKAYFQFFNGYGESLIDYDKSIQRVGTGVVMADWL